MGRAKIIAISILAGWLTLVSEEAIFVFIVPHGPHFAPEIGPLGSFIFFMSFFSVGYLLAVTILEIPMLTKLAAAPGFASLVKQVVITDSVSAVICLALMMASLREIPGMLAVFLLPALAHALAGRGASNSITPNTSLKRAGPGGPVA